MMNCEALSISGVSLLLLRKRFQQDLIILSDATPMIKAGKLDQRRHRRVPVVVTGRYMLPDRQEFSCKTIDISAGGLLVQCEVPPYRRQRVVVYLDQLGRVEGIATRVTKDSFAVS